MGTGCLEGGVHVWVMVGAYIGWYRCGQVWEMKNG